MGLLTQFLIQRCSDLHQSEDRETLHLESSEMDLTGRNILDLDFSYFD
jgi:hypothetical protein